MNNLFDVNNLYTVKNIEQKNDSKKTNIKHIFQNNMNVEDRIKKIKEQLDKLSNYDDYNNDENNIYK